MRGMECEAAGRAEIRLKNVYLIVLGLTKCIINIVIKVSNDFSFIIDYKIMIVPMLVYRSMLSYERSTDTG